MSLWDSIKRFAVGDEEETEETTTVPEKESVPKIVPDEPVNTSNRKTKLVNLNTGAKQRIEIMHLESNEGVKGVLDLLKEKIPVVVNIARLDSKEAIKTVYILSGAAYAVDGDIKKASVDSFLLVPHGIEITGDVAKEVLGADGFSAEL